MYVRPIMAVGQPKQSVICHCGHPYFFALCRYTRAYTCTCIHMYMHIRVHVRMYCVTITMRYKFVPYDTLFTHCQCIPACQLLSCSYGRSKQHTAKIPDSKGCIKCCICKIFVLVYVYICTCTVNLL